MPVLLFLHRILRLSLLKVEINLFTEKGLSIGQIDTEVRLELPADGGVGGGVEVRRAEEVPEAADEVRVGDHFPVRTVSGIWVRWKMPILGLRWMKEERYGFSGVRVTRGISVVNWRRTVMEIQLLWELLPGESEGPAAAFTYVEKSKKIKVACDNGEYPQSRHGRSNDVPLSLGAKAQRKLNALVDTSAEHKPVDVAPDEEGGDDEHGQLATHDAAVMKLNLKISLMVAVGTGGSGRACFCDGGGGREVGSVAGGEGDSVVFKSDDITCGK
nr:hypothetical protein Iba_chr02bCG2440 [Ipomoea batatas]